MPTPIKILTEVERKEFDSPPLFSSAERKRYFNIPKSLNPILAKLRTEINQILFILMLGYFKSTGRFFSGKFINTDVEYVSRRLGFLPGIIGVEGYDKKATANRHRKLILDYLGFQEYGKESEQEIVDEIRSMIRSQMRPKFIFLRIVELLRKRKIECPSAGTLTELVSREIRKHRREITEAIEANMSDKQKDLLNSLLELEKNDNGSNFHGRYRLTLLKKYSHSTKPSKIKNNIKDLKTLRELYQQIEDVIETLDLSEEGIRYYANSVIKSQVLQISRRSDENKYLHLICFVAHQFFRLQDIIIDSFLFSVKNIINTCRREHKELYYGDRNNRRQKVKSFAEKVYRGTCSPLGEIEKIAFCGKLSEIEKVSRIQKILNDVKEERECVEQQVSQFCENESKSSGESGYYDILESKSIKMQNRVSEIVKEIDFEGDDGNTHLFKAIQYYKEKNGIVSQTAPTCFLDDEEKETIFSDGKLRVSLYKVFLFIKIAEAVKAGILNVRCSYKYRSLNDYMIPKKLWQKKREEYLRQSALQKNKNCQEVLATLTNTLDAQINKTNRRILDGENEHIHFRNNGTFYVLTPKAETDDSESLSVFFPKNRYISLLEVLATVNRTSDFLGEFRHWQIKHNKSKPKDRLFLAGIIGYGCFIGTRKIAQISKMINESELENTINWYFCLENVHAGNDKILRLMDQLELPELYRNRPNVLHTSSDGQKFEVAVDSLNANYSFKYFGQGKGVSAYNFIDERNFLFHSDVISSSEREAAYVIDGLMHNDVVKSNIHSTDTHGYSEVIFAVLYLLGFTFAPRIKNLKKQRLYSFSQFSRKYYEDKGFCVLPDGYINTALIEENWEDILRFVATIQLKETTASQLFKRLNSYSKQHCLWKALKEFGKVIKTIFILNYIDDVDFRQAIEKQLNKSENSNKFSRAVSLGNNNEFLHGDKVEQSIAEGCRRLIKNAIICWNYLFLSQKIYSEKNEQKRIELIKAVKTGSMVSWKHINLQGEYDFSDTKLQDSVGLSVPKNLGLDRV